MHIDLSEYSDIEIARQGIDEKYRFIHGHVDYLYCNHISQPFQTITFLRDPITRIISLYQFMKNQDDIPNNFEEFIRYPLMSDNISNYQSKLLGANLEDQDILELALERMEKIYVGITEYMDASISNICNMLGLPYYEHTPKLNQSINQLTNEVTPQAKQYIRERNDYDFRLYDAGIKLLKKRLENDGSRKNWWDLAKSFEQSYQSDIFHFSMRDKIIATGFFERESENTLCWRFTDNSSDSYLYFQLPKDNYLAVISIAHHAFIELKNNLQLFINGEKVRYSIFHQENIGDQIIFDISKNAFKTKIKMLEIKIASADGEKKPLNDNRNIGFAISSINFIHKTNIQNSNYYTDFLNLVFRDDIAKDRFLDICFSAVFGRDIDDQSREYLQAKLCEQGYEEALKIMLKSEEFIHKYQLLLEEAA